MRSVVVGVLLVSLGCAGSGPRKEAWRDGPERSAGAPRPDATHQRRSADEVATALEDDIVCHDAVRQVELERDREYARALMIACAARNKWSNLRDFLRLHASDSRAPADMALLAQVLAMRGGEFQADLPSCQSERWPLRALPDVFDASSELPTWIVFRAKVGQASITSGVRRVELAEQRRRSQDVDAYAVFYNPHSVTAYNLGRVGSEDSIVESGVQVHAELPPSGSDLVAGSSYIFLARFVGIDAQEGAVRAKIVAAYRPGVSGL